MFRGSVYSLVQVTFMHSCISEGCAHMEIHGEFLVSPFFWGFQIGTHTSTLPAVYIVYFMFVPAVIISALFYSKPFLRILYLFL